MGTTLENGVYLPSEGERNCYAGLKTNWEILDQKVADVTALQQAVAGALHRQIVTQLPTEDIDPNTIYMILSGTSATENVYNEYMYVNNAWELIGTSATDLTNYYTKAEVDGKLLLKANASDLTSHTGDTTIHVTASDKTKWTNSAKAVVFRYSSTTLVASSTNSNTLLDNTDNLKVGDKVIDSSGVLFSITAIDTQNSTFTIGTALIDLAQDSDVVHKSGNETVGGVKTFTDNNMIKTSSPKVLLINTSQTGNTPPSANTASFFRFDGGTVNNFGGVQCEFLTTGENRLTNYVKDITTAKLNSIQQRANSTTAMTVFNADLIVPATDGVTALGNSSKRWSDVQTYKVNALEPSSLGMPDLSNGIDISSYVDVSHVSTNYYTPPANGWISISVISSARDSIQIESSGGFRSGAYSVTNPDNTNEYIASIIVPCVKNDTVTIYFRSTANTSTIKYAKFFPCLGNV